MTINANPIQKIGFNIQFIADLAVLFGVQLRIIKKEHAPIKPQNRHFFVCVCVCVPVPAGGGVS